MKKLKEDFKTKLNVCIDSPYSLVRDYDLFNKKILDVGCGLSNHNTVEKIPLIYDDKDISKIIDWTGIDINFEHKNNLCKFYDLSHIKLVQRDLIKEDINLQEKFDLIIIKESLHFSTFTKERRKEILTECVNMLENDGCIYFNHYIDISHMKDEHKIHYYPYCKEELDDFKCIDFRYYDKRSIITLIEK